MEWRLCEPFQIKLCVCSHDIFWQIFSSRVVQQWALQSKGCYGLCWQYTACKCPNTQLFLVGIQSECGKIRTRNNSVFGHFSLSGLCSWHLAVNYFVKWFQHRSHCAWSAHVGSFSDTYFAEFVLIAVFVHKYPYSVSIFAYNVKYTLIMR